MSRKLDVATTQAAASEGGEAGTNEQALRRAIMLRRARQRKAARDGGDDNDAADNDKADDKASDGDANEAGDAKTESEQTPEDETPATAEPAPTERVRVTADINVRREPKVASGNIVGGLYRGHEADTFGREGDWLVVHNKGEVAYIYAMYTEPVGAKEDAPPSAEPKEQPQAPAPEGHADAKANTDPQPEPPPEVPEPAPPTAAPPTTDKSAPTEEPKPQEAKAAPHHPEAALADPAAADMSFEAMVTLASSNGLQAAGVAMDLIALRGQFQALPKKTDYDDGFGNISSEEQGKRNEAVRQLGIVRGEIDQMDGGMEPQQLALVKGAMYRALGDLSPYWSQWFNADVLYSGGDSEKGGETAHHRTCNLTSLAMVLESLGKTADDYSAGERPKLLVAAAAFHQRVSLPKNPTWEQVASLRFPDFLELAMIVLNMSNATPEDARTAAAAQITDETLVLKLTPKFGVNIEGPKKFDRGAEFNSVRPDHFNKKGEKDGKEDDETILNDNGASYRGGIDHYHQFGFKHNQFLAKGGKEEDWWKTEDGKAERKFLDRQGDINKTMEIESYKQAIVTQAGAELDKGNGIFVDMYNHFTRLQAIHDDGVVIDDPGNWDQSNLRLTWEEARSCGLFLRWTVLKTS